MPSNSLFSKPYIMCHSLILWPWAYANHKSGDYDARDEFYLRQTLGVLLMLMLVLLLPNLRSIIMFIPILSWAISLIGAMRGVKLIIPIVGVYFQKWFKDL